MFAPAIAQADSLSTWTELTGETAEQHAGKVVILGDINADGYDDFAIAAPYDDTAGTDAGAVYLYYGDATAITSGSVASAIKITGEAAGDYLGLSLAGLGDVNNDGYDDFAIGAPYNDAAGTDAGAIYLLYGKALPYRSANLGIRRKITGEASGDGLGRGLVGAGDVNGDGYSDILTSAPSNDDGGTSAGAAYIIYGHCMRIKAGSISRFREFTGAAEIDLVSAVGSAGDVNGDGFDDILIGASGASGASDAGAAYLLYGRPAKLPSSSLSSAVTFSGVSYLSSTGHVVTGVGDLNADGYDDFIISAYAAESTGLSNNGEVFLFYGQGTDFTSQPTTNGVVFTGVSSDDFAGQTLAAVGDVNADGYDDFMIGAPNTDTAGSNAGSTYLIYGQASALSSSSLSTWTEYTGENAGDGAGYSITGNGDINGDGTPDVLIGSDQNDDGGSGAGAVYLYYF